MTTLMQGLIQLSGQPLVHSLGWTLLHFCWQGLAVAAVLWCVLALLGGRSSQARYGAACVALALMVVLPAATFAHIASADLKARAASLGSGVVLNTTLVVQAGADEPIPPWPARIGMALDHSLPWILLAWFVGVLVFVSRLNFGLLIARRLKTAGTEPPPPALLQLFDDLRIPLGVARAVKLLHSVRVQVPTVIGWLRPVVLLPVSCLSGLSPDQIEAVLCHELAHVRRHDYLVSVIQSVIETVLFYHPAVWWVSKQVRRERECCCDELAVGVGGNVLAYARALSFLEESRAAFPEFVLGANGGVLKMRIKRILGTKGDLEGSPVAALLALGIIVAVAGSYFIAVSRAQAQAAKAQASYTQIATAVAPAGIVSVSQEGTANPVGPAADNLHGIYKVWLEQDVRWIITDSEAQAFKQLTNDQERDTFIQQFWAHRDPPGAAAGTYREEHYARIAYSNEHFATDHPGWKSDRGHIYIVYGKPESIDSHPSRGASGYPYEVWHYKYIAGIGYNIDISFVDTCRCGQYNLTIDRPGLPGPGAENGQARAILASRILAPGGAGTSQTAAPQSAPTSQAIGSISGTIVDPNGALVPRAQVTTVNTDNGVKTVVQTDNTGTYSFPSLPPGPYNVEVEAKGFQRLLQENVHVNAGQGVGLNLKLTVGAATENLTVTGTRQAAAPPPPPPPPRVAAGAPKPTGPQRVSSGVMAGLIISQPQPVYPDQAKAQRIQGVVVLHAHISKGGTVKDLQVISGPPALMVSSIDAVRQWKYKPYLIDGEPTEVDTTININYTLAKDEPQSNPDTTAPGTPQASAGAHNPLRVGAGVMQALLISKTIPVYPPIAKAAHVQGDVVLHALISKTGDVEDLKVLSGPPMLTASAIDAVRHWKYDPYIVGGVPVEVDTTINVNFTLADAASSQTPTVQVSVGFPNKDSDAKAEQEYKILFSSLRKIGGNVSSPELIYKVDPEVTAEARKARFNGIVLVNFIVDEHGVPQNVHILRGVGMGLDEQAVAAVKQYRFKPAFEDGKPVPVELNVEVNFQTMDSPQPNGASSSIGSAGPSAIMPVRIALRQPAPPVSNAAVEYDGALVQKLGDGVTRPKLIHQVFPEFSDQARKERFNGGLVLVNFIVDKQGKPQNVRVTRGIGHGLDQKAVEAVKQYRFEPATKDGNAVPVALNVEVNFQMF